MNDENRFVGSDEDMNLSPPPADKGDSKDGPPLANDKPASAP